MNYRNVMLTYAVAYTLAISGFVASEKGLHYVAIGAYISAIPMFIIARQKLKNMVKRNRDDK